MSSAAPLPEILTISQVLRAVPEVRSEPLVTLAHRNLEFATDDQLSEFLERFFDTSYQEGLSPSEALSLIGGSYAGREAKFRKLGPSELWSRYGLRFYNTWPAPKDVPPTLGPKPTVRAGWWGDRFEAWAASVEPHVPGSFRTAVSWSLLSALMGDVVTMPVGDARLSVALAGAIGSVRDDAQRLGGPVELVVDSTTAAALTPLPVRLAAIEPDWVAPPDVLRELQRPPDRRAEPSLLLLISEALDGLEQAQAVASGPLIVESSQGALDTVTALKTTLAAELRASKPDIVDAVVSGSAQLVRKMAALVAVSDGGRVVSEIQQTIAIDAAADSLRGVVRRLNSGRWLAWQV